MKNPGRIICSILLIVFFASVLLSCVTKPDIQDYQGIEKEYALNKLENHKTTNMVKLLLNWFLWGGYFGWIPSIIDTFNYISYEAEYNYIERQITEQ